MFREKKNAEDTVIETKDYAYNKDLSRFIAKSFKSWDWQSDAEHLAVVKHWEVLRKNDDFTALQKKEWIRFLLQKMNEERASATTQFTNEF